MKYYSEDHQWVEIVGDEAVVGLSEYAVEPDTEVSAVELPDEDTDFIIGDKFVDVAYEGGELQVTVSVGVALYPVDSQAKPALIHKSDLALYASKHGGRDRVTLYGDVPPEELQLAEESHA